MAASEAAVTAVMEALGCRRAEILSGFRAVCTEHWDGQPEWTDRGCPVAVAAANAALDADRASIQAETLREAEAEFASRTQEAAGEVREHWRGQDFVDGQDTAYDNAAEWCGVRAEQLDRTRREVRAMSACQTCGHLHSAADVRAVDRFNPAGAAGYRALHDGAPLRRTRYQADKDACLYRLARKEAQP